MLCFWGYGQFALPSAETVLYGIMFGIFFFLASAMSAKGNMIGSMALTSVIINMSLIVPLLSSITVLKEPFTVLHAVGFCFFTAAVVCSAWTNEKQKKASLLWLVVVLVGFCANGLTATIQKIYVMNASVNQDSVFLGVAYLVASLCFLGKYLGQYFYRTHSPKAEPVTMVPFIQNGYLGKMILVALLAGVGSFGGNLLLGRLTPVVNAAILYPCINGGLAICITLVSFFFFREKPTIQKICAIILGCIAIVILNLNN
jgi:drug/metabolite transporter (DMT)-like permease